MGLRKSCSRYRIFRNKEADSEEMKFIEGDMIVAIRR